MYRCLVQLYVFLFYPLTCFFLIYLYSRLYSFYILHPYCVSCLVITGLSEMSSDYHYDLFYFSMYSMVSSLAVLISKYVSLNIYSQPTPIMYQLVSWFLLVLVRCALITIRTCFIFLCILWFLLLQYLLVNVFLRIYIHSLHLFIQQSVSW